MKKLYIFLLFCSMHGVQYCSIDWKKDVAFNKSRCYEIFEKLIHFLKNTREEKLEQFVINEVLLAEGKITKAEHKERIEKIDPLLRLLAEADERKCSQYDRSEDFYFAREERLGKKFKAYREQMRNYKV